MRRVIPLVLSLLLMMVGGGGLTLTANADTATPKRLRATEQCSIYKPRPGSYNTHYCSGQWKYIETSIIETDCPDGWWIVDEDAEDGSSWDECTRPVTIKRETFYCPVCHKNAFKDTYIVDCKYHDNGPDYHYPTGSGYYHDYCVHNHYFSGYRPNVTPHYYSPQYDYSGDEQYFDVYPLTATATDGFTTSVSVGSATITSYVYPSNTVQLTIRGTANRPVKITNNGTSYLRTTDSSGVATYSFTMPKAATSIQVEQGLAVSPSPSQINLFYGQSQKITPNQQPTTAAVTYLSSDDNVVAVNSEGEVTSVNKGQTTIKVTATL